MEKCPRCKGKLTRNTYHEGYNKPSTDWYCKACDDSNKDEYTFYDSEI